MALLMSSYTFFSSTSLCYLSISRNKTPKLQKCSKVVRNGLIKAVVVTPQQIWTTNAKDNHNLAKFPCNTDGNQNDHDGSYVECYMKERQEASVEEAREHMLEKISESWKCLNKECLISNRANSSLPPTFVKASLNLARLVPLMYSYDDNQQLPSLEEYMKSKLYECVVV